jgi:pimeloyl-ACP methyl ester carboxylesterase
MRGWRQSRPLRANLLLYVILRQVLAHTATQSRIAEVEAAFHEVRTPDGRWLNVRLAGPEHGDVVLFHTGTPDDGPLFAPLVEAGAKRGLRHLGYSRPGYGDSDRSPGRIVADCADDVSAIVDALGIESFFTVGWSGGGPHALACAALIPKRIRAAATIASVAPRSAAGLDWLAGMGEENLLEFAAAEAGEEELRTFLETQADNLAAVSAEEVLAALGDLISAADRPALTGHFAEYVAESTRAALRTGIWGWFDDDMAFNRDWGFDLGRIHVPVAIWQGGDDRFVPFPHGAWLAENVNGATSRLRPREGHLSLAITAYGEILDGLLGQGSPGQTFP